MSEDDFPHLNSSFGSTSTVDLLGQPSELEIEELDDQEYDIPPIGTPPTLESILNEPDDVSLSEDDLQPQLELFKDSGETTSVGSSESFGKRYDRKSLSSASGCHVSNHGSLLRHVILRGVSSQLLSAAERVSTGKPTAMAVSALIAVGTFHGMVLVFDSDQVLKWCLGSHEYGNLYGSVSALTFNGDCTRLLCGYARGQITMWDVTNGKLLRTILDAHPPETTVLHLKFTDDPALALCSDSGGSVFELIFRRVMGTRTCESRCIFSGSRGEVCTLEPLRMSPHFKEHSSQGICLVALGTVTKVIVVTVRPYLRVWFTHHLKADSDTLPLICWQFVVIQVSTSSRVIDPVLAFGRQSTVYFYQVTFANAEKITFIPLQKMQLRHVIQNLAWLNTRTIVTLDKNEQLHVIDVKSDEELEVFEVGDVELVYGNTHFKGLATGGNVSKAMAVAGERACYYSFTAFGSQLLLLGLRSVHVMSLRTWVERLDLLVKQRLYLEALALAFSFFDDSAKAVAGITGKRSQRQQIVGSKMGELLEAYTDVIMTQLCPERGKVENLLIHYRESIPAIVKYSLAIRKKDFLFGKAYERFSPDPLARSVYLESLEPFILDGRLTALTPAIAQAFVAHYKQYPQKMSVLEACIVRLDVTCLDLHQVLKMAKQFGLYDAFLYVHNRAMADYITPMEDLFLILQEAIEKKISLSEDLIRLGNKILVYISCCLAGRGYPLGEIPPDMVAQVKISIFQCISKLHSSKPGCGAVYPYLKTLLHYDTREFLNVLAIAFEEFEFNTENGISMRQRLVDILLQIMVASEGFTPSEVGALFTFLARQMAKGDDAIVVNRMLFDQVLEYLTNPDDETRKEERQHALMDLLQAGAGLLQIDENKLMVMAEKACFYRVCEHLYQKHRQFDKILSCYLQDPARRVQAFYFVEDVLRSKDLSSEERKCLEAQVMESLEELVQTGNMEMSDLLIKSFPNRIKDAISILKSHPSTLYNLLQGVFSVEQSNEDRKGKSNKLPKSISQELEDEQVRELYIELMCQFQPTDVAGYIKTSEGYRLQETLELCKQYEIRDGTAYLMEKAGDIHGAFALLLEDLELSLAKVVSSILSPEEGKNVEIEPENNATWKNAQSQLNVCISLCQRNTGRMDMPEKESLWFPLLEAALDAQVKLRGDPPCSQQYIQEIKKLTRELLDSMMGYVALPSILQKMMQNPVYSSGKLSEVRDMIMAMLETYNYEKTLLHTVANLLQSDLHVQLSQLCRTANRGLPCHSSNCYMCLKPLGADCNYAVTFLCGHGFHKLCLERAKTTLPRTSEPGLHASKYVCCLCQALGRRGTEPKLFDPRISQPKNDPTPTYQAQPLLGTNSKGSKVGLDPQQSLSLEMLLRNPNNPSRARILEELLAMPDADHHKGSQPNLRLRQSSVLSREDFQLRLLPARKDLPFQSDLEF